MRTANLFLFLGTIGFLNIYEDLMGEDDSGKMDPDEAKRLANKYGVKEKRSAERRPTEMPLTLDNYSEQLVEYLKRPVLGSLDDCHKVDGLACNCLTLICFGQADCTANVTHVPARPERAARRQQRQQQERVAIKPGDPRYVYYSAGRRLRARHGASWRMKAREAQQRRRQFLRCRQTTINPFVLCECKRYTRIR